GIVWASAESAAAAANVAQAGVDRTGVVAARTLRDCVRRVDRRTARAHGDRAAPAGGCAGRDLHRAAHAGTVHERVRATAASDVRAERARGGAGRGGGGGRGVRRTWRTAPGPPARCGHGARAAHGGAVAVEREAVRGCAVPCGRAHVRAGERGCRAHGHGSRWRGRTARDRGSGRRDDRTGRGVVRHHGHAARRSAVRAPGAARRAHRGTGRASGDGPRPRPARMTRIALTLLLAALCAQPARAQQGTVTRGDIDIHYWPGADRLAASLLPPDAGLVFPGLPDDILRRGSRVTVYLAPDAARFDSLTGGRAPEWGAGVALPQQAVII